MAENPSVFRQAQLGVEPAIGTLTSAGIRLTDIMISSSPSIPRQLYRPQGFRAPTSAIASKESVVSSVEGRIGYNSLIYILSSLFEAPASSTPSGATATRRWAYLPSATGPETLQSYTCEVGNANFADRSVGNLFSSLSLTWNRTDATLTSGMTGKTFTTGITLTPTPTDIVAAPVSPADVSIFAGTALSTNMTQTITVTGSPTGGTFKIRYTDATHPTGEESASIAYDANAAAVQTALQGISLLGSGNVTVTGGPGPGTPWVATFTGEFAGVQASLLTLGTNALTGGTSPTVTVAQTQAAGLSRLTRVDSFELTFPDMLFYNMTLDQNEPSWSAAVELGVEPTATLSMQHDSQSISFINSLRSNTLTYLRVLCRGNLIEAGFRQTLIVTFPFRFTDAPQSDVDGVWSTQFPLGLQYDSGLGSYISVVVENDIDTLAVP